MREPKVGPPRSRGNRREGPCHISELLPGVLAAIEERRLEVVDGNPDAEPPWECQAGLCGPLAFAGECGCEWSRRAHLELVR